MAGLLADVFSFGDTLKRKARGLLDDPAGSIAQWVNNENDRARQFNQLTRAATDEATASMRSGKGGMGPSEAKLAGLLAEGYNPAGVIIKPGQLGFDPRFDPRAKEVERLKNLAVNVEPRSTSTAPVVSLTEFEGRPFITSMADRTAAGGVLTDINGVKLNRPVDLLGGQDYMFDNPGQVWASAQAPVKAILRDAQVAKATTGQDPLYIPWRMAPTGGDFAHMTGETMINYADAALGKRAKSKVDKAIAGYIPEWAGVSSPESVAQFRSAPDSTRKAIKNMLDVDFRDAGALSIGEARLAVTDTKQLNGADGGLMNIGEIFADRPMIMESGHPSYPRGVPGQGIGRLDRDINVFQMLPHTVENRGIPNAQMPRATDLRALQMKPYYGLIDDKLLKSLGY